MSVEFLKVNHSFSDSRKLEMIMSRQFPAEEYMSLETQLALQDSGELELWALYFGNDLAGFTTLRTTEDMVYLFFLAFDDGYQGKGLGHETLKKIGEIYSDRAFTVDFEQLDETADNNAQRIRRRNFYLNCGFSETGWGLSYLGVTYEIFCMNKPFQIEQFKVMLDKLPVKDFSPKYFRF